MPESRDSSLVAENLAIVASLPTLAERPTTIHGKSARCWVKGWFSELKKCLANCVNCNPAIATTSPCAATIANFASPASSVAKSCSMSSPCPKEYCPPSTRGIGEIDLYDNCITQRILPPFSKVGIIRCSKKKFKYLILSLMRFLMSTK